MIDPCLALVSCMSAHPHSVNVARWGLRAVVGSLVEAQLAGATAFADCQRTFREAGACDAVVKAMRRHPSYVLVARHGLLAILYLAHGTAVNATALGAAGACQAVVEAMRRHASDAAVAQYGGFAAGGLACDNAANCSALGAAGACQAFAAVLRKFTTDAETLQLAAASIVFLARWPENQAALPAGICEGLVSVLQANILVGHEQLVEAVKTVLMLSLESAAYRDQLGKADACQALLAALSTIGDDADMQWLPLAALANLAENDANRERLGTAAACRAVITTMQAHPTDESIQKAGLLFISTLASNSSTACARLYEVGVCELLTTGLESSWKQMPVSVVIALTTVGALSCTLPNETATSGGLCAAVLAAMSGHTEDVCVQSAGVHAIRLLASNDATRVQLRSGGALQVLAEAMRAHQDNSYVQKRATIASQRIRDNTARIVLWAVQRWCRELLRRAVSYGSRLLQLGRGLRHEAHDPA
eukprot:TRINITY_DN8775_c0_g2_i2.p1 TRINITY_DN8775_c0_g2~~TRINITY_DN8775_c0_g2_i2.p1  ORF type:complete len:478 (-),score=81.03 TRINITY_DN8775_c0_g2_i2:510-1943(-)